ncbi:MAG: DUF2314 domain-containing protein [Promethearchaeota archaeon]
MKEGDLVKLRFKLPDGCNGERMWIEITKIFNNSFMGVLDNDPLEDFGLKHNDKISFESRHIIDIWKRDE